MRAVLVEGTGAEASVSVGEVEAAFTRDQKLPPDRRHGVVDGDHCAARRRGFRRPQACRTSPDDGDVGFRVHSDRSGNRDGSSH